ncbi:MAG: hypothetical protein ACREO8_14375 [Luteimonas sp.]
MLAPILQRPPTARRIGRGLSRRTLLACVLSVGLLSMGLLSMGLSTAQARTASARIARVTTPVATLHGVSVRLDWRDGAAQGELNLRADRIEAVDLGYRFRDLAWRCPLSRDGRGGWHCDGELRAAGGAPMRLALDLGTATTAATLSRGASRVALQRSAATPDDTTLDLIRVPLAWTQALASQAWAAGRLTGGTLDGPIRVHTPTRGPLRVDAALSLADGAIDTADASIAAQKLAGSIAIDYRRFDASTLLGVAGTLRGGELLFGGTYIALPASPVALQLEAMQRDGEGWTLPSFHWRDGEALLVDGSAALTPALDIDRLDLRIHSADAAVWPARYLSGQLGVSGLAGLQLRGGLDAQLAFAHGDLAMADARLRDVALHAADDRFAFEGLDGDLRFSSDATAVDSTLRWRSGALDGIAFGAAQIGWRSANGELTTRAAIAVPMLDGSFRFDTLTLRPPKGDRGLSMDFALTLDRLDIGKLSASLGGPAFRGTLSGRIPAARYANERIDFDGGLAVQAFDGTIAATSLSMERPFGVAPTLSADLALQSLDLQSITEVFGFGSISGRLDGRIAGLRLVDWSTSAFDAELHTVPTRGVRQRISQRAVQNISSVGDASFVTSLQGRLIGLFDDFGYRRIGISCRLSNEVCAMGGLRSADNTFTIVEGSGIPRLDVVGFNRQVDWPVLVERIEAVGSGDLQPVYK